MTPCEKYDDQTIESYVLETLPDARVGELEEHCFVCDRCFTRVRQLQNLRDRLAAATEPSLDGLEPRPLSRWRRWGQPFLAPQSLALAATVAMVVLGLGRQQLDRLQSQLAGAREPRTSLLSVTLSEGTRAGDEGVPAVGIDAPAVLEFDLPGAAADAEVARVVILDAAGDERWASGSLPTVNEYGTRVVMLAPGFLEAGRYRLEVRLVGGDTFVFPFLIVAAANP